MAFDGGYIAANFPIRRHSRLLGHIPREEGKGLIISKIEDISL